MNRPNNFAPKSMEGYYTVYIKDNKMVVAKHKNNTPRELNDGDEQVVVKCHPDDSFNISEGMNIAMEKLGRDIKIGDEVIIVDNGKSFTEEGEYIQNRKWCARFRHGVIPKNGTRGKVVEIINNGFLPEDTCAVCVDIDNSYGDSKFKFNTHEAVYLMDKNGLKKV